MKKYLLILLFFPLSANAVCATKVQRDALNVRAMQSYFMISALSCGNQQLYNQFMNKFNTKLKSYSSKMKNYFAANYGGASKRKINNFVTKLANEASGLSLKVGEDRFCDKSEKLFDSVLEEKEELSEVADNRIFISLHDVKSCK